MKTTDGGSNWTTTGTVTDFNAERLTVDPWGKRLIAVSQAEDVWMSSDDGRT
jgi:hypothetical protein